MTHRSGALLRDLARDFYARRERVPDIDESTDPMPRCRDCGELGEQTGHMGCQYPRDHEGEA